MTQDPTLPVGHVKATPTKRALRNDARKLGVVDAITEIIDNAIDNHAKQSKLGRPPAKLEIAIHMSEQEVAITENSGGVTPDDLQAFVQIGSQGETVGSPRIGVWGAGQKLAVAALGNDVTISTRYWKPTERYKIGKSEADQVVLKMDDQWWADDSDWDVPAYLPPKDLTAGVTRYGIRSLNRRIDDVVVEQVVRDLREFYGDMLYEDRVLITVNGERVEGKPRLSDEALKEEFASPPGFEPSRHWFIFARKVTTLEAGRWVEVDRSLKVEIVVGLTPRQDQANSGVWFYGVPETESGARLGPRYFAGPVQDESVGYTSGPRSILRKGHPTLGRLKIYVICYGDSEIIPWGLPGSSVKRGYNASNVFADDIREAIRSVAKTYVRFTAKAREIDIVPYSKSWNSMDIVDRKGLVRRGAYLQSTEDLDDPGVAPKIAPLLSHEFRPPDFIEWDHSENSDPPASVPALEDDKSKEVVSLISERDKRLKELHGLDPGEAAEVLTGTLRQIRSKSDTGWPSAGDTPGGYGIERPVPVTIRLKRSLITRLTTVTGRTNRSDAIIAALEGYLDLVGSDDVPAANIESDSTSRLRHT